MGRKLIVAAIEIKSQMTGTLWKLEVSKGTEVKKGQEVAILESMKMEIPVEADNNGTVVEVKASEGDSISEGDTIIVMKEN